MGWFDYFTDMTSSLSIGTAYAEQNDDMSQDKSVTSGGMGTAQQRGGAVTKGGATPDPNNPASGTDEESSGEKEANEAEAKKGTAQGGEAAAGHKPGDGGEGSGQVGAENAGPHGGSVKGRSGVTQEEKEEGVDDVAEEDDAEEEEEEEEEEEDEPEDLKPKLEEECLKSKSCAPLKHHYDECAERVTQQHEQHGKPHEDCVEEYFHMMHCAAQCAAPKLWKTLR
ncbi:hypothetical protein LTR62_003215 [Meristemomyces frigidus]|uniref:Cytochrome b-c1 complex subunit 6, mitochondrial n=1 Tax=Meristemomyces frigidus TaxID=1508187 RepID=A0AAN7TGG0_9PEZI|nr:hypothetical protein LTR62_003215 [Meristemomyces frigidus]